MHAPVRFTLLLSLSAALLFGCKDDAPAPAPPAPAPPPATLALDAVSPAANSKVSAATTVDATLTYALAEGIQSSFGFELIAQFQSTNSGVTIGTPLTTPAVLVQRAGTISVSVPLAQIVRDSRLARPITAYFYLLSRTAPGAGTVIAKVGPIVYTE